jgi:hypothetical protein
VSEETKKLQEMLERATAPGEQMPGDWDAETSSLRDSWLTLSRLLEDATPADSKPGEPWKVTPRPARRRRPLAWAVAVAASLLIAAGLTIAYRQVDPPSGVQVAPPVLAQVDPAPPRAVEAAPDAVAPVDREPGPEIPIAAVSDEFDWDSSLDDEITAVAQAAVWVRSDWYAQAVGFSAVEHGLDEIKKDIEDSTL